MEFTKEQLYWIERQADLESSLIIKKFVDIINTPLETLGSLSKEEQDILKKINIELINSYLILKDIRIKCELIRNYSKSYMDYKLVSLGREPGLIIPMKTGVKFTNQVDGISCQHPELEGIYIPLSGYSDEDLTDIYKEYPDCIFIIEWIKKHNLPLELLDKDWFESELGHYPEAWVNVRIIKHDNIKFSPFKDFVGMEAILTCKLPTNKLVGFPKQNQNVTNT